MTDQLILTVDLTINYDLVILASDISPKDGCHYRPTFVDDKVI